jgi:hypothetical protein
MGIPLLERRALSGRLDADFHAVANFALTAFSEVRLRGFSELRQEFIGDSSTLASVAESAGVAELRSPAPLRKEE